MKPPTAPIAFTPAPSLRHTRGPRRGPTARAQAAVPGPQTPMPMTPTPQPVQTTPVIVGKTNLGLLVGVAVASFIIGVVMALAIAKLVGH